MIIAEDHEVSMPFREDQLFTSDAGERLERRTGRAAAIGTMAIGRVEKLIQNRVCNRATKASPDEYPSIHLQSLRARPLNGLFRQEIAARRHLVQYPVRLRMTHCAREIHDIGRSQLIEPQQGPTAKVEGSDSR